MWSGVAGCGTLHVAFERCQRMGYLERLGAGCDAGCCDACGASCASPRAAAEEGERGALTGPAWWRLTESGLRVVKASGGGAQT